ncbi:MULTISPECIES: stage II sporulation protein M [Desulfosporosinus]|uniref:Stage II sporulation protein M n=2 Tax=Desulfosporosinus TaxID=79206 RepID=A0A1M5YYF8_9FIRM|nr:MULTISPECIES: stage II sporulation protein M [Desulfosporosinus]MCO1600007.1 stage II sporulation protein M [Desulfosporosinus nitroreducens]MDO0822949.1 stage II sporulation protein M [Desulfosporosinus nitroreducens]SHI17066.1 stage II sporulation protein M [Desulfosporosinus lacus DSM 15449]
MWKQLGEHIRQYWVIYLTLSSVYLAGVVFGGVGVNALGVSETSQLVNFLDTLLKNQPTAFEPAFLGQLARDMFIMMAGIWILGLTIIGAPLIYLIVFTRGFILGFTISFIIGAKGTLGIALVLTTVFVPTIFAVPLLLLGAGLATIFSFLLLRGKARGESLRREFLYYTAAAAFVSIGAVAVGVAQGYFSILGLRLLTL